MFDRRSLLQRAIDYANSRHINLLSQEHLGFGTDGVVWETDRDSVVKVIERPHVYRNERDCYRRFLERGATEIAGFAVPVLIDFDDELLVIEMTIVDPPRILDFGKVAIDTPPKYFDDKRVLRNEQERAKAEFGDDWPSVAMLLHVLWHEYGIFYADPTANNIIKHEREPGQDDDSDPSPSPQWDMDIYDDPE